MLASMYAASTSLRGAGGYGNATVSFLSVARYASMGSSGKGWSSAGASPRASRNARVKASHDTTKKLRP